MPLEDMTPERVAGYVETPEMDTSEVTEDTVNQVDMDELATVLPSSETVNTIPSTTQADATPTEEVKTEATTAPELTDFDNLTPREKLLLGRIEQLTTTTPATTNKEVSASATTELTDVVEEFLGPDVDIDDVLTPTGLNQLLNAVYTKAMTTAKQLAAEQIMATLPATISTYVRQHMTQQELINTFYAQNPDLANVKRTVAAVANEIAANNPEYTLSQVFDAAATQTRTLLQLKKPEATTNNSSKKIKNPGFVNQRNSGGRVRVEELTGMQKEIADMLAIGN